MGEGGKEAPPLPPPLAANSPQAAQPLRPPSCFLVHSQSPPAAPPLASPRRPMAAGPARRRRPIAARGPAPRSVPLRAPPATPPRLEGAPHSFVRSPPSRGLCLSPEPSARPQGLVDSPRGDASHQGATSKGYRAPCEPLDPHLSLHSLP